MSLIQQYHDRGWSILPIPFRSKNPGLSDWQNRTFSPADFRDGTSNVGIHLGKRSGRLVDVDLDHLYAVEMADEFLPSTPAVFGRKSKPRSHRLYVVTAPVKTKQHKSPGVKGSTVEIRSTGGQTVFPPSVHPSGESIEWDTWPADPARIDPVVLHDAVDLLARAVRARLAMDAITIGDANDGSLRLLTCACRCVEHDLDDASALVVIRHYEVESEPFAIDYSDDEIIQRLRDAETKAERGDAVGDKVKLSAAPPEKVAVEIIRDRFTIKERRAVHAIDGDLLVWREDACCYRRLLPKETRSLIRNSLPDKYTHHTNNAVASVIDAVEAAVLLPYGFQIPGWANDDGPAGQFACKSGLVNLDTGELLDPTPEFVNFAVSPVAWEPDGAPPAKWPAFLESIWPGDRQSKRLLKQWFGYCLTPDTRQQKILMVVGKTRSGKGTIARVMKGLLGADSIAGPTLASLSTNFGLQSLIDKPLAIISDARLSGKTDRSALVERLLSISGEDTLTVDRKHQQAITRQLPTRLMILTNELPRLAETSGALANRFIILRTDVSFLGREDTQLRDKLLAELPGILQWSVDGLRDLRKCGRFAVPDSSDESLQDLKDLSSPLSKFIRERCTVDPHAEIAKMDLYAAYRNWCHAVECIRPPSDSTFGKDLKAIVSVKETRPRNADGNRVKCYQGLTLKA